MIPERPDLLRSAAPTTPPRARARRLQIWHRRLGLSSGAVVVFLAVTGVILNHATALHLDDTTLHAPWLLALYDRTPNEPLVAARLDSGWAVQARSHVYLPAGDGARLDGTMIGAAATPQLWVVASAGSLLLFTHRGGLVESIDADLPLPLTKLGLTPRGEVAVAGNGGTWIADAKITEWRHDPDGAVRWVATTPPPPAIAAQVRERYGGDGISLAHLVADLHSGRILGAWGGALMDAAAVLFSILTVTGTLLWWRRRA